MNVYWNVSVGLKCVLISRTASLLNLSPLYIVVSKKVASVHDISVVNLIVGWCLLLVTTGVQPDIIESLDNEVREEHTTEQPEQFDTFCESDSDTDSGDENEHADQTVISVMQPTRRTRPLTQRMIDYLQSKIDTRAVASMRRTEALASVKFYQMLSIFFPSD